MLTERQQAYQVYLRSCHWRRLRLKAFIRDKFQCVNCGAKSGLNVHHFQYRDSPYQTKLCDVMTLCRACHEKEHEIQKAPDGRLVHFKPAKSYLKPVYPYNPLRMHNVCHRKKKHKKARARYLQAFGRNDIPFRPSIYY